MQNTLNNTFWIGGKNAVEGVISNKSRVIKKIFLTKKNLGAWESNNYFSELNNKIEIKDNSYIQNRLFKNEINAQGYAVCVNPLKTYKLNEILSDKINDYNTILALDEISDQRNIGAIIRVGVAFNVKAFLVSSKFFDQKNNLMLNSASGAFENSKIVEVSNIHTSIRNFKKKNFYIYGLDGHSKEDYKNIDWKIPKLIILGSEGKGIKNIIKKECHTLIKIPISKKVESLNVSTAAAVVLSSKKNSPE